MITHHHRYMSHVPRWGIVPVSRFQSVSEHSYFVSLYVMEMLKLPAFDHWTQDLKFCALRQALVHDVAEARMSDIPGPVKRMIKDPAKYEATELRVTRGMGFVDKYGQDYYTDEGIRSLVKVADLIDEYMFLTMERVGGNGHVTILQIQVEARLSSAVANCDVLGHCKADVLSWVGTMMDELTTGLVTLQNNEDVDGAPAACSDKSRCGLNECPVCEGVPF